MRWQGVKRHVILRTFVLEIGVSSLRLPVMYVSLICEAKGFFNNKEQVLCCIPRNIDDLSPYTNEEADIKMLLHAVTQ